MLSTVEAITAAIAQLPPEQVAQIRDWLNAQTPGEARDLVLEEYDGFVERFVGDVAYVTLKNAKGETLGGEYPVAQLLAAGVRERRHFKCRTVESGDRIRLEFEPTPDLTVSPETERALESKLRALCGDDDAGA